MQIDLIHFTPWLSLAGGALIGLAAAALFLLPGRILGVSGIVGGLLQPLPGAERNWRFAFVAGLIAAPGLWRLLAPLPVIRVEASLPMLLLAGLLVGIGTRYGGGCTSGHGVCGLARLSPRSLLATLCFMASGFATVFLVRHVLERAV